MMGVDRCVISTNIELKNDGEPYSNRREPVDPGAAVYFTLWNGKPCALACDKWQTVGENLWAIAKHIEALRGQDRWGVGTIEQAFAGYAALEYKTGESCWEVLGVPSKSTEAEILKAYRDKAKTTHPDAGGSHEAFDELCKAKDICLASIKQY